MGKVEKMGLEKILQSAGFTLTSQREIKAVVISGKGPVSGCG